jgi:hypothetical protein
VINSSTLRDIKESNSESDSIDSEEEARRKVLKKNKKKMM